MNQGVLQEQKQERTHVERLVDIADAIFDRAGKLDSIKFGKHQDEVARTIAEMRDEGFRAVITIWRLIVDMLPTANLEFVTRKELEIDAYKVISRCFHRLGDCEEARRAIVQAIDLGYIEGFISLGAICIDMNDTEGAENAFNSALAKDAESMRAHAGLGELYFAMGTKALRDKDSKYVSYFEKAEEEFVSAGKERFTESYERAMDLFETIGFKDRAIAIGAKATEFYTANRLKYGDRLRTLDNRLRKLAGDERYERILTEVRRKLGNLVGGKDRDPNR